MPTPGFRELFDANRYFLLSLLFATLHTVLFAFVFTKCICYGNVSGKVSGDNRSTGESSSAEEVKDES